MPTTFQRKPSVLPKLLFFCHCFSLGLSRGAATHFKCVYRRPAHCSPRGQAKPLQAGRQILLLAGQLHNKRFRSANESPVEETEVLFRPCKKAICKQVHNYTPWFTHEPLPHPKILIFLFVLLLFSSFSAHIVLLALWVDLQDLLLTYFSIVTPAALTKKLGRTERLGSKAAKASKMLR